jgi:hypothetical protein
LQRIKQMRRADLAVGPSIPAADVDALAAGEDGAAAFVGALEGQGTGP